MAFSYFHFQATSEERLIGGVQRLWFVFSFSDLPWWFWAIEMLLAVLLFGADAMSNWIGIKKFGGTNAGTRVV